MAEWTGAPFPPVEGCSVSLDPSWRGIALRYFSMTGAFAQKVSECLGMELPPVLGARMTPAGDRILAWRSPTETLCLGPAAANLAWTERLANAADGYCVDLSSALGVLRILGGGGPALLARLGSTDSVPAPGEARRSRMADVAGLALSVRAAEILLVVDRAQLPHVAGWIRATLEDLAQTS
jgi:sarcosine oxidase gamma subunit